MVDGGVHVTPYSAVTGIGVWAIDVWNYIKGKCLFQGVKITELDAVDAFDVLHYLYEEDLTPQTDRGLEVRSKVRETMYSSLYNRSYRAAITSTEGISSHVDHSGVKPYILPTNPEDLSRVLEPALGE